MSHAKRSLRDTGNATDKHYALLAYYFLYMKAYRSLIDGLPKDHLLCNSGSLPSLLPKDHLYKLAGQRVYYKSETAARYIRKMLDDDDAVREAMIMINEGLA